MGASGGDSIGQSTQPVYGGDISRSRRTGPNHEATQLRIRHS
ncbi:hypothetical protein AX774_g7708, partial [Zancudomyces culisetae]